MDERPARWHPAAGRAGAPEAVDLSPLIVTAVLDEGSQAFFDDLRARHFPAERNHLDAHLTLFHALPGHRVDEVAADLADVASSTAELPADVVRVRSLGRGVAYDLTSPGLAALRDGLAGRWRDELTQQDAQGFRAHVTVQNKVEPVAARRLLAELEATFQPWTARVEGLALWRYRGGPWDPVRAFDLTVG